MASISNNLKGKGKGKAKVSDAIPSANWLALQKKISNLNGAKKNPISRKRKRPEAEECEGASKAGSSKIEDGSFPRMHTSATEINTLSESNAKQSGFESVEYLKKMVLNEVSYTEEQKLPGRYLALDCEMVGVGPEGSESSLARVSLVNYYGAVIMDEFVRQRERVVDYRTAVSGVREADMIKAKPFTEVQKQVAELLTDRILVGHAVNNDLKALLLSHPRQLTRDTQLCAGKARLLKTKYPALRKLTEKLLGITIQAGEHSSVTDARATMAIYRLHRKEWDKGFRPLPSSLTKNDSVTPKKRKIVGSEDQSDDENAGQEGNLKSRAKLKERKSEEFPGGGRRGVSSGLSTIIKRGREVEQKRYRGSNSEQRKSGGGKSTEKWWTTLSGVSSGTVSGSKGSLRTPAY